MTKMKKISTFNFGQGLTELEEIVQCMEKGSSTLEDSLEQFGRAIRLLQSCQATLKKAEQRIKILCKQGENDRLVPFKIDEEVTCSE